MSVLLLTIDQFSQFALEIATVLDIHQLPYYVGNPLASALWRYPWTEPTKLVLVVAIKSEHCSALTANLIKQFFVNPTDVQQAIHRGSGFTLRHLQHQQIAEIWLQQADEFSADKMNRRLQYSVPNSPTLWLCSPEDAILDKLLFEVSGRSHPGWPGLIQMLKVQSPYLDYAYLGDWSTRLGLSQLLSWALLEAEI
jgi:hypothetical protein